MTVDPFAGLATPLTQDGLETSAELIDIDLPTIWAVIFTETSGCGFFSDGRPKILFERHVFHRLTGGRFDADDPDVSQPTPGGYGSGGAHQYDRLTAAILLDRQAALQSASWGLGQIMGENWHAAGFTNVEDMVTRMVAGEDMQFRAMASFIKSQGVDVSLRSQNWASFARVYNGPNFAANNYDSHLRHFHDTFAAGPLPELRVRALQILLMFKGFDPGTIDGVMGPKTRDALRGFEASNEGPSDPLIDDALLNRLSR
jgi:N-acetylmuramidase/Putative peptidoglycan binding domain